MIRTKQQAVRVFGDTEACLARALGLSRQAIARWPHILTQRQRHEVFGAAVLAGRLGADLKAIEYQLYVIDKQGRQDNARDPDRMPDAVA